MRIMKSCSKWCGLALLSMVAGVGHAAKVYNVHTDHLGTPQVLTDENHAIVWSAKYQPFGEVVVDGDPDGDGEVVEFNLRFPGQYYDKATGVEYNYFRDYDPSLGRYIQSDPIGLNGGLNTYAYVGGNPLMYTDPTGEYGVGGAIGGGLFNFGLQLSTNLFLTDGDLGRSLRCINLTDILVSAAVGAVAPSLLTNVIRGKAGPVGLTQAQNAYIYLTKAVPVGFSLKKGIPDVRPSDFSDNDCDDECSDLKLTNTLSKIIQ